MGATHQVNEMLYTLSQNGYRVTEQRRTLLIIALEQEGHFSPKDIYEQMSKIYPSVSFDTVYRNLRILNELELVEQFYFMDGGLKFKICCHKHHHHHLICLGCERTLPFDYCPMDQPIALPENFKILNHRFEIYGLCSECQ